MDLHDKWEKALKKTEILRLRASTLFTFKLTELPYIFLGESAVNIGDTVVRKGKVLVHEPSIFLPPNFPQFEGFEFEKDYQADEDAVRTFLLVRGVSFPSLKYTNEVSTIDVYENSLSKAINHFSHQLEMKEDIYTALIVGPEDCWQFSVLIFVCAMVTKSAPGDLKKFLEDLRKRRDL